MPDDGKVRPYWANSDPLMRDYYDHEWGIPVRDERGLFERLTLEAFQSGLSWRTILNKRPAFREAFAGFDPEIVANFGDDDVARLLDNAAIVRNRRKILATIANARATLTLREQPEFGADAAKALELREQAEGIVPGALATPDPGLPVLIWSYRPENTPVPLSEADTPTLSPESTALAKELKKWGFAHLGPTTLYALFSAVGIVDLHPVGSFRRGCSGVWDR